MSNTQISLTSIEKSVIIYKKELEMMVVWIYTQNCNLIEAFKTQTKKILYKRVACLQVELKKGE